MWLRVHPSGKHHNQDRFIFNIEITWRNNSSDRAPTTWENGQRSKTGSETQTLIRGYANGPEIFCYHFCSVLRLWPFYVNLFTQTCKLQVVEHYILMLLRAIPPPPLFFFACGKSPQVVRIQRMAEGTLGSVKRRWAHEMSITVQNNYGVRDVIL